MKESSFLDANQLVGYASGNKELNSNILLSDIARTLIKSTSLSEKLNAIISLTGKALNVSRVYIFEDDLERAVTNNAYEWCNVGIEPEIENLQNFPIALAQDWYDIIGSQGYISAHDIRQLPPSIIKILEPQNIVSIIVFRLMLPTGTSGFVGFDECREKRYWSNYEIEVLQAINGIIISLYENDYLSKKLHDSNINFYNMFNSIADFMFVADTEGFLIEGNLALHERTIFKSLKEAGNKIHIIDMHPQKYKKEVEKIIKQMVKGEIDSCTLPLLDSDGYEIEVNTKVWRGYWDNKEVLLGISKDISKEVVALEMFNKLFDNNPLAVLVVDVEQRRITRINNSFEKIFDYTIEEIDNLDIDNLQIWTDREYAKGFLDLIAKDQNLRSIPITLKKRNGQFLNGVLSTTAIDIQGKKQITAVFTDLSEQIELQERLAEQKQRLEHIITSSDMGTWEWDLETDETIFNEKWAEMVGYKLKDLEPTTIHTWRNLLHPADIRCTEEELNKYFRGESPFYSIESRMRHKNGSYRWIYDTGKVVEYNNLGKPKKMFGSHLDISKIKMAEEQLFEAKLKAEKESESKSKFLANVSHEIRTPIHTMQGITEMLAKTKLTDKQKTYALYLQQSSNILLEAIHNILDFTKIEANKIDLHNHKFLLNDVVDSIINMFAFRFAQKGLTFLINVDCSTPLDLFGDYYKLSQILQNLLSNAEKFTPKGTVTLKIEPEKQLKNTVMLKFSVIDTGYGIDAEMIPKIFDSYVQDQKLMAKSGTVGSGLGLFIVEQLVTLLDGEITVESIKDEGTTFSVIVPFKVNSEFKIKTIYTENWVEPNCQIVIDDSPTGQIIKNSFDSLGIKYKNIVQKLNNSKNASLIAIFDWELAVKEKRVDLILEKMKREGDKIFYIVISSVITLEKEIKQHLAVKALQIVKKPVHLLSFLEVVKESQNILDTVLAQNISVDDEHGGSILLVEDHAINREITAEILYTAGYEVECAESGLSALEKLKNKNYDLVLLDLQLPDIDGFEVAKRIRHQLHNDIPITALSAHVHSTYEKRAKEAGVTNFISKPVSPTSLYRAIDSLILTKVHKDFKQIKFESLGVDFSGVMNRYRSNTNIYYKHVSSFTIELTNFLNSVEKYIDDKTTISAKLHSIKGVAANLGMQLLAQDIVSLEEELSKEDKLNLILPKIVDILLVHIKNGQTLLIKLKPYLEADKSEKQFHDYEVALDEKKFCANLKEALKTGDVELSLALVKTIQQFKNITPFENLIKQMLKYIENYDFLDAEQILETVCDNISAIDEGF